MIAKIRFKINGMKTKNPAGYSAGKQEKTFFSGGAAGALKNSPKLIIGSEP